MADLPPALPTQFQIYNTYVLDPPWQVHYTMIWAGAAGVFTLLCLPAFVHFVRSGRTWQSIKGVSMDLSGPKYQAVVEKEQPVSPRPRKLRPLSSFLQTLKASLLWTLPGFNLDLGQLIVLAGYLFTITFCIVFRAPLKDNPNRAGFMTLAQLPFVFLFATKNSVLSLLWQKGYEKLNFLHRWAGRGIFLSATIHGAFWIQNHLVYDMPIMGASKERLGVLAFLCLGIIVLTSLGPVRRFAYQMFFYVHVVAFVTFFVLINYHTPYSTPWIFPPLAFYGLDLFVRLLRYRIKEANLVASDDQMTFLQVHDCDDGWVAGQHVRLRIFSSAGMFQSHPLTIINAPPSTSCSSSESLLLGARVNGDWTKALNILAREGDATKPTKTMVMLDGPYGGSSIDLGEYETVLLFAGGSGITFTLALLDDIIGRVVRHGRQGGERTTRIEFAWCIRSFGHLNWFAPMITDIASFAQDSSVDLHISVFVTCLCDPGAVPIIPNCDVTMDKPSVRQLMKPLISGSSSTEAGLEKRNLPSEGGGFAMAASGPASLTREARNAIARMSFAERRRVGNVALHTELFSI